MIEFNKEQLEELKARIEKCVFLLDTYIKVNGLKKMKDEQIKILNYISALLKLAGYYWQEIDGVIMINRELGI